MAALPPGGTFIDDNGNIFEGSIEAIAAAGITKGCNPPTNNRYCPNDLVTRGEMAVFLVRAFGYSDNGRGDLFTDDNGFFYENAADRLKTARVTLGCNPPANTRYCGERPVTRGQIAAFLVRALGLTDDGGGDLFTDDDDSLFEAAIDRLGTAGITRGCNPPTNDRFCPDSFVTRGQMAAFLTRALRLTPIKPPPISDAIRVRPGVGLQGLVDSNPPGSTFLLESGVHRNLEIASKEGNVFVGESGAVMDGGGTTTYAFQNDVDDVTIIGLIIQNYDNPVQRGVIDTGGSGWRVIGNEIRFNAGAAINIRGDGYLVDGNHIHHNEQIGVLGRGVNGRVVNNEIAYNNPNNRYSMNGEAGGTKFLHSTNLYIANNYVHDNHGAGLWTDNNNYRTVFENNTVRNNYGPGILHEISYDAVIRNNTVTNNAHQFYIGGILVANSSNVEVYDNTVTGNSGGIAGIQDARGSGPRGEFATTGLHVHDNTITYTTGWTGVRVNSGTDVTQTGTITFNHNTYTTANISRPFFWDNNEQTIQQWINLGHDTNSTFN